MPEETALRVLSRDYVFRVTGTDMILPYYEPIPFMGETKDWDKARGWLEKLTEVGDSPTLDVFEALELETDGESKPARIGPVLTLDWSGTDADRISRRITKTESEIEAKRVEVRELEESLAKLKINLSIATTCRGQLNEFLQKAGVKE